MKNLINKLLNRLNRIGKDKHQHFTLGALIALAAMLVALPMRAWWGGFPPLVSMLGVVVAALLKERKIDAKADFMDILWTLAGGGVVWATMLAFNLLIQWP